MFKVEMHSILLALLSTLLLSQLVILTNAKYVRRSSITRLTQEYYYNEGYSGPPPGEFTNDDGIEGAVLNYPGDYEDQTEGEDFVDASVDEEYLEEEPTPLYYEDAQEGVTTEVYYNENGTEEGYGDAEVGMNAGGGPESFGSGKEGVNAENEGLDAEDVVDVEEERPDGKCPPMTCSEGSFLKPDCTCTFPDEDPCNACPEGTRCQRWPEPMCIDCNCGFCDFEGSSCCTSDREGICMLGNTKCVEQSEGFPAFLGVDDVCNGVETADVVLPHGCGCALSATEPCDYSPDLQSEYDDGCYICTTQDIVDGECTECVECLERCDPCISGGTSPSLEYFVDCLTSMDGTCRAQCNEACKKAPDQSTLTGLKVKLTSMADDIDIDEMLAQIGLTKAMVYAALPFAALVAGGMMMGCLCSRRK